MNEFYSDEKKSIFKTLLEFGSAKRAIPFGEKSKRTSGCNKIFHFAFPIFHAVS